MNNTGQISGWGIFRTGGMGLDNHGSITLSGGTTTVDGPVTNENGQTITVAYNPAIFTGSVTNDVDGDIQCCRHHRHIRRRVERAITGPFANAQGAAFAKAGSGTLESMRSGARECEFLGHRR